MTPPTSFKCKLQSATQVLRIIFAVLQQQIDVIILSNVHKPVQNANLKMPK